MGSNFRADEARRRDETAVDAHFFPHSQDNFFYRSSRVDKDKYQVTDLPDPDVWRAAAPSAQQVPVDGQRVMIVDADNCGSALQEGQVVVQPNCFYSQRSDRNQTRDAWILSQRRLRMPDTKLMRTRGRVHRTPGSATLFTQLEWKGRTEVSKKRKQCVEEDDNNNAPVSVRLTLHTKKKPRLQKKQVDEKTGEVQYWPAEVLEVDSRSERAYVRWYGFSAAGASWESLSKFKLDVAFQELVKQYQMKTADG